MKAIILAAGQGIRLKPLTNDKPKCLVELFGNSLINHSINTLQKCGISDITIVTGYLSDLLKIPNVSYVKNENYASLNLFRRVGFLEISNNSNGYFSSLIYKTR